MRGFLFTVSALLFVFIEGFAQTQKGDFDITNYPEVSFVWNEYNPQIKDSTQFVLTSGSRKIPFRLQKVQPRDSVVPAKSILFLWEDLNHRQHAGQSDFTRNVLYSFLINTNLSPADRFNVAVFDRKGGNDWGSIHSLLSNEFTSDFESLAKAVAYYRPKYDFFSNQANSELYTAIEEGIELLQQEASSRTRVIVVFTAGSNQDSYGGRNSIDESRALSLKIPVYVVKYPIPGCEHCTNIDVISRKTYGMEIITNKGEEAFQLLQKCYWNIPLRHYGHDYRISFTAPYPRDGQQHALALNAGGKEYSLTFAAPAFSLKVWATEHVWESVLIIVLILLIIFLAVFLLLRQSKLRRREMEQLERRQRAAAQEAEKNKQEWSSYVQQQEADEQKKKNEDLARLMRTKNMLPRLQYSINGALNNFTVAKPKILIGRDKSNDLELPNDSVSKRHAEIVFNGSGFEIHDLGSTNKVIVNGAFVERASLKNGDIIGLGEVVIYFYC